VPGLEDLSFRHATIWQLVKSVDEESGNQVYAVVYHATTMPIDSTTEQGLWGCSLQGLARANKFPDFFAMLKTEFRARSWDLS